MKSFNFNHWTDPTDFDRNELVFEKRNKAYGAYFIRKNYNKTLVRSLAISVFLMVGLVSIPKISQLWAKDNTINSYADSVYIVVPFDATPIEKISKPKQRVKPNAVKGVKSAWREISDLVSNIDTTVNDLIIIGNPEDTNTVDDLFVEIGDLDSGNKIVTQEVEIIEISVSIMPEFIGGEIALFDYLRQNLEFPQEARELNRSGKVNIGFVVEKNGSISSIKILSCSEKDIGFENEAIRVISQMPIWKPGIQNGRPVKVLFSMPINFRLF